MTFLTFASSTNKSLGMIVQSIICLAILPIFFIHSTSPTILIPSYLQIPFFGFLMWSIFTLLVAYIITLSKSTKKNKDCHYCDGKVEVSKHKCVKCGKEQ